MGSKINSPLQQSCPNPMLASCSFRLSPSKATVANCALTIFFIESNATDEKIVEGKEGRKSIRFLYRGNVKSSQKYTYGGRRSFLLVHLVYLPQKIAMFYGFLLSLNFASHPDPYDLHLKTAFYANVSLYVSLNFATQIIHVA
jgi:hypothetical protein